MGNLREIHAPGDLITYMEYDLFGRRTYLADPATGVTTTNYNALGLPASGKRQGIVTANSYDELGRPLKRSVTLAGSASLAESFIYDEAKFGIGKLSYATGPNSSVEYTYDRLSRPIEKTEVLLGKTYKSQTEYDAQNRISKSIYPGGFAVSYVYDEVSQLKEIKDIKSGRAFWSLEELYPSGDVKQYRLGNGVQGFKVIDSRNDRIQAESIVSTDQSFQMSRTYEHDAAGNLLLRKDNTTGVSESFTYDALDRLETFTGGALKPVKMSYDHLSRISSRSDIGTYEYGRNCESGFDSPFALKKAGSATYCTDARGNITKAGSQNIAYDANNLPVEIKDGTKFVKYQYGLGKQILSKEESVGDEKTLTRYAGGYFEVEESSHGTKERYYVGDFLVVEMEGSDYREHYLYKDYLGSTLVSADQTGSIIEKLDYDPFGQRRNTTDLSWLNGFKPKTTNRGFTGHNHVESMNLIHMKGRVYDPTIGIFLSPDPYVQDPSLIQNLNRYSYVLNNPLRYTDPTGHFFKHVFKEINKGLSSAGKAIMNPGRFLENTWNKAGRAASDPRYQRLAASVAISVLATIYQPQWASESWKQSAAYFSAVGATSSYVATNGDKKAALSGAMTGAAFNLVGSGFELAKDANGALSSGIMAAKIVAHGTVGGLSAVANGGRFESGFLTAGLSEFAGQRGLYGSERGQGWEIASGAARAAIIGGTISTIGGGSFESGALNAAMGRLFNGVAHANPITLSLEEIGMAIRGFVTTAGEWVTAAGRAGAVGIIGWAALHSDNLGDGDTIQPTHPVPKFEDFWDPTKPPEGEWEWRGRPGVEPGTGPGNWVMPNPNGGRPTQSLNPDLDHPEGIKPHWDWTDPEGKKWRIFEGGLALPK